MTKFDPLELEMQEGSLWEVKLLRYICIGVIITLLVINIDSFPSFSNQRSIAAVLIEMLGRICIPLLCLYIAYKLDQQKYPKLLLIFILGVHLFLNLIFLGGELDGMSLAFEDKEGEGRWVDYVFRHFPSVCLIGLAFLRLWAVLLWILLSTFTVVRPLLLAFQNPYVYLENDWNVIIADGFAVNAWMLREQIVLMICFVIGLFTVFLFNKKLLESTIETEKTTLLLGRYFSPDIQKEIQGMGNKGLESEPVERKVAILFTDIVGFTKLSEDMNPKDVLKLLSEYQSIMVNSIFEHKGSVDKFIGDAIMANFGTPRSRGDDAQNAYDCAVEMNTKLKEWNRERSAQALPIIEHRVGLHFGDCVVGNMGNSQRLEFAVIGDAVNVASRICDACKEFDTNFLISAELHSQVVISQRIEQVKNFAIRGRKEPIDLVKIYVE